MFVIAQNPLRTFSRNFPVDGEVANLLATSRCNGIWETPRHNRHNGRLPAPTCYRLVADLSLMLRTYGETDAMDFGLISSCLRTILTQVGLLPRPLYAYINCRSSVEQSSIARHCLPLSESLHGCLCGVVRRRFLRRSFIRLWDDMCTFFDGRVITFLDHSVVVQQLRCSVMCIRPVSEPRKTCVADALSLCGS